jgi:hypothetical protein
MASGKVGARAGAGVSVNVVVDAGFAAVHNRSPRSRSRHRSSLTHQPVGQYLLGHGVEDVVRAVLHQVTREALSRRC